MSTVDQATSTARTRRSLVAGTVGNFVEWYEFGAYGFFATVIAANFFSSTSTSDAESLIKTYASFALAFFFRPIGAAVFGRVGRAHHHRVDQADEEHRHPRVLRCRDVRGECGRAADVAR